ncbi:A-kinase anchor protein 9 isoform X2 [Dendroctonus ponderosae]|uniref:A-kinase anchor protein 9 isoform X2 n=1 Tax=Dendroctonus ponderosae TaxID=77166 RepID=UPI002035A94A|nr:A-kinase anchor protein 9 isoform X2 [Dendroctonus ponderosae]
MEGPDNLDETSDKEENASLQADQGEESLSKSRSVDDADGAISEASISEHITSNSGSIENDRSFQEIEVLHQTSAFVDILSSDLHISQELKPNSLDLSSFGSSITNGLPMNTDNAPARPQASSDECDKNVKSILEEILNNSQFHSDFDYSNSKDDSFNLFANVNFSDKSLLNIPNNSINHGPEETELARFDLPLDPDNYFSGTPLEIDRLKDLEEIVAVKDSAISALTQELDSFREMSNPTFTSSMVSATEYRQMQEECHNKLLEYNSAILYKNDLIQQLSESLDQSVTERKQLLIQLDNFKEQVAQLQEKVIETYKSVEEHTCVPKIQNEENKPDSEILLKLRNEVIDLQQKIISNETEHEGETSRLRGLLESSTHGSNELMKLKVELEEKHAKEVEELRTYFEKKCAELEKHYSEEVFSQQSRRMSGSSSEVELSADFLLSSQPGPGGDHNRILKSKEDVEKLKENLAIFVSKLSSHSMENISDKQLANIEIEVKNELNTLLKIGEKLEIKAIENKYLEEISNLKFQLEENPKQPADISFSTAVQEVASSGDYELNEVVESYERRLQEQIDLAKIDIANDLASQLQRLISNESEDEDWPPELLKFRDKFTSKHETEINHIKEQHNSEMTKLKEEHFKILNGALERARRRSLRDGESLSKTDLELLKERDGLKKQVVSLRNLLSELVKYFTQAEDELNNTLVDSLVKRSNDSFTLEQLEEELNLDVSSGGTTNSSRILDSLSNKTRVHLAPNFSDLINMIDYQQDDDSVDIAVDLKNELGMCLEKLKHEANAVLALSSRPKEASNIHSPQGDEQFLIERFKQDLINSNQIVASLEKEKEFLEVRVDELVEKVQILDNDLEQAKYQIAELIENRHVEVISEGFGERDNPVMPGLDTTRALCDLQEKARSLTTHSRATLDPNALQLIEELCRVGEKIKEESKKEFRDLLQQIEAADKKYKATQKFLEEQAVEREQERDEAQKQIDSLYEQLKDREKDKANCQIMSAEHHVKSCRSKLEVDAYQAEQLEQQIQELNSCLQDQQHKYKELEGERDEAVEKITILRDIIKDLEQLSDSKDREIEEHLHYLQKLECIVNQQNESLNEYKLFTAGGNVSDIQNLRQHCEELEEEVQKLRIGAELAGSEGELRQIKIQLFEIEVSLDKKTKELELLHSSGTTSCSSPSEDMSVRDLIRPQTPNSAVMDECEVPLQQLARLKEKLLRHSRAEEAAIKRMHDMDMQITSLKNENDEANNEKEFMKRQIHEQLVLISDFQIRLDQQRIKAEHIEKQTNTSLEIKIYDLQNEILDLQEKIQSKDKTLHLQEQIIKETQQRLQVAETEIASEKSDEIVVEMQKELEALRRENRMLKEKSTDNQMLPNLVENIIQDKNSEIEKLRDKQVETERLLFSYTSLNLNSNDLKTLANLKNAGGSIEQLISILDLSQPIDQVRRCASNKTDDFRDLDHISMKTTEETSLLESCLEPEISSIQRIAPSKFNRTLSALGKSNSTQLNQRSAEKRVHFKDPQSSSDLIQQIEELKAELADKNKMILELDAKLRILDEFENKITLLQGRLDETEQALTSATATFEKEQQDAKDKEQLLGVQLAEKKMHLSEKEKEVQALKEDSVRKDEMYLNLAKEKRDLELYMQSYETDSLSNLNKALDEKNSIIDKLQMSLKQLQAEFLQLDHLNKQIGLLQQEVAALQTVKLSLEENRAAAAEEITKLKKTIADKNVFIDNMSHELESHQQKIEAKETDLQNMKQSLSDREKSIADLQEKAQKCDALIVDKQCDLDILNEDLKYYQNRAIELENNLKALETPVPKKSLQEDQLKISELTKEVAHLEELMREKDTIINQMTEDHKQVHMNIKAIDNKIKETGNIFDLSNRLKNEQKKNADLFIEIHKLKAVLYNYQIANNTPVEEITGQLKRELECAAELDSHILTAVSDQSLSSISEGQDAEVHMKSLTRQKNQNKQLLRTNDLLEKQKLSLQQQCNNLQQTLNEMQNAIEKEKMANKLTMIEDSKLMEQLRIKLEYALNYQEQLEKLLNEERVCRRKVEIQCEELKKPSSSSESTKYNSLPTQDARELSHLKKELKTVKEKMTQLLMENKSLDQSNNELKSSVKYTKEMLELETERNRAQEEKFRILQDKERHLSEELLRKKFEMELKEREVEESKIKMDELEQEKTLLKKQKAEILKTLKEQAAAAIAPMESTVPETLGNLIKELKDKSDENKQRLEYIEQIEREKKLLENQLRTEMINSVNGNMPFADLVARCNYLFAKSLKLESVKKALIWQKRYLVDFLQSHQRHCLIEVLPNQPHENYCLRRRHSPIQHFRAAVYTVISIQRMQFLVRRWHTGMRKYEKINARHYQRSKERFLQENPGTTANFQVGQPVSNQYFPHSPYQANSNNPFRQNAAQMFDASRPVSPAISATSAGRDVAWSGNTPPSKDNPRNQNTGIQSEASRETFAPLRAPHLLSQLHERVEQIQEKLSLPFSADLT